MAYARIRVRVYAYAKTFDVFGLLKNGKTRIRARVRECAYTRVARIRAHRFLVNFWLFLYYFLGFSRESNPDLKEDLSKLRLSNNNSTRIIILNFLARNVEKLGMTFCRFLPNKSRKRPRKSPGRTGDVAIFGRERGGATGKTPRHPRRKV